jgi:hypothetical protein
MQQRFELVQRSARATSLFVRLAGDTVLSPAPREDSAAFANRSPKLHTLRCDFDVGELEIAMDDAFLVGGQFRSGGVYGLRGVSGTRARASRVPLGLVVLPFRSDNGDAIRRAGNGCNALGRQIPVLIDGKDRQMRHGTITVDYRDEVSTRGNVSRSAG